jgi:hypothetical protein
MGERRWKYESANQMIEGMSAATTFEKRPTVFLNQRLPDP